MRLTIAELQVGKGVLGICPSPGRAGFYQADLEAIRHWHPSLVITFTTDEEIIRVAATLPQDLSGLGIQWLHLPIQDYGTPTTGWPDISTVAHAVLNQSEKILLHCMGGCGRSGMAFLRLMIEQGEAPESALKRLRQVRPCAVETDAQYQWASQQFI